MVKYLPAIEVGFEDEDEFTQTRINQAIRSLSASDDSESEYELAYKKGSVADEIDSYMPTEEVTDKEVRVGPYNLSVLVLAYLSNQKLQVDEERKEAIKKALGKVLKHRREEIGLSQGELEDRVKDSSKDVTCSRRTIIRIENGETLPHRDELKALCDALELNYFFCLQRTSRLYWETYDGESFPSLKEEYSDVEI